MSSMMSGFVLISLNENKDDYQLEPPCNLYFIFSCSSLPDLFQLVAWCITFVAYNMPACILKWEKRIN